MTLGNAAAARVRPAAPEIFNAFAAARGREPVHRAELQREAGATAIGTFDSRDDPGHLHASVSRRGRRPGPDGPIASTPSRRVTSINPDTRNWSLRVSLRTRREA